MEPALRNVSFTLQAGETLAVVGYNGSGELLLLATFLHISPHDSNSFY
jgi:ABC-type polysaccharide/polyol phosphate transport system ATPase subunit